MRKVHKMLIGFVFATMMTLSAPAFTEIVLGCSGGTCCTYNGETGEILDCHPA